MRYKEDNFLISPAHFDPDVPGSETRRGLANIQHVNGLCLDNDGGDLSHADFAKLFPQLRMLVWNTHSSTREYPRWRCFIPTDRAMSVDEHARLIQQIVMAVRHNGFNFRHQPAEEQNAATKHDGFDRSKFTAASLFYAPCQAASPRDSFFIDYDDPIRAPLAVGQWLENDIATQAVHEECEENDGRHEDAGHPGADCNGTEPHVSAALNRWRSTGQGHGHHAFFRLASDLRRSGMGRERARHHLRVEARKANSPRDRQREIPQLINRIWKQ